MAVLTPVARLGTCAPCALTPPAAAGGARFSPPPQQSAWAAVAFARTIRVCIEMGDMRRLVVALLLLGCVVPLLMAAQHSFRNDASFVRATKTHLHDAHGPVYLTGLN
jgi:hypothetical protein